MMNCFKFMRLLAVSLVLFPAPLWSAPVGSEAAAAAVKKWLQLDQNHLGESLGGAVKNVDTFKDAGGNVVYHAVYLDPSGFVIVSAEDTVEPIVAFASRGRFDPSLKNALGALVTKDVPARVAHARAHGGVGAFFDKARNKWRQLSRSATPGPNPTGQPKPLMASSISGIWVAPFLPSLWDQETVQDYGLQACFNYYTPPYGAGNSNNFPSGCVATAISQLMYYFQFPTSGVGTGSFPITVNGSAQNANLRGGNGSGGAYSWANMPPILTSPTTTQCQAIGALLSDAGVAIHMDYEAGGSGSFVTDAKTALVSTFKFNSAVLGGSDNPANSLSSYIPNMANPNLDARMPVVFGIQASSNVGHCMVCDGYGYSLSTLYHHVNMGWSGQDNAWYTLPLIDTTNNGTFTNIDSCIYNVYVTGSGEIISGRIVDSNANPVTGATVTATKGATNYTAVTDTNGIYALPKVPSNSSFSVAIARTGYAATNRTVSTGKSTDGANTTGNVWGANFTLVGSGPPLITVQPQSQTFFAGTNVVFAVTAAGAATLTYHWQKSGVYLTDGGNISGSSTTALTVTNISSASAGNYSVVVSNSLGTAVSVNASLTVYTLTGTSLIQNGGFESDNINFWTLTGEANMTFVLSGYSHSGTYSLIMEQTNTPGYLSQTVTTTSGATYLLSVWMDNPYSVTPNEFSVSWNGSTLLDESNFTQTGWINYQYIVTANASATTLKIGFWDDPSTYLGLDDVSLTNLTVAAVPQITGQPTSLVVKMDATTNLVATVSGPAPLHYQWQFDGTNIAKATNLTLSITNIQGANAGSYQLIATNSYGTASSAVVMLSVLGAPVQFATGAGGVQYSNRQVFLQLTGLAGQGQVIIDASTNLILWTPVFTNPGGFGAVQFTDTGASNLARRFYRARTTNGP